MTSNVRAYFSEHGHAHGHSHGHSHGHAHGHSHADALSHPVELKHTTTPSPRSPIAHPRATSSDPESVDSRDGITPSPNRLNPYLPQAPIGQSDAHLHGAHGRRSPAPAGAPETTLTIAADTVSPLSAASTTRALVSSSASTASTASPAVTPVKHNHNKMASLNMHGVFLHVLGDALGSVAVMVSALIIWLAPWPWRFMVDPVLSLIITAIILWSTIPLVRRASAILLQGRRSAMLL